MTSQGVRTSPDEAAPWGFTPERAAYIVLAVALAHAVAAWLMRTPGLGWGEDDAGYLLLAQQLRHFSYREVQDVLAPVHARFPPVFPLMLAVVGAPFGDRLDVLLAFVALCSAGSIVLLFDCARRFVGTELALLSTVLYAINPNTVWDASNLMAEAPFKLLVILALWALSREQESARYAVLAGAAVCLAALTRSAGVIFVAALFAYWVVTRRYRWALLFGLAATATVGVWLGYAFTAPDPDNRRLYVADLVAPARRTGVGVVQSMVRRLVPRSMRISTVMIPFALSFPNIARTLVDNVAWLAATIVFGACGLFVLLRRWLAAALFLIAYFGLLLVWRWAEERFVNPIVPLLYVLLLTGASWLAARYLPRARRAVLLGLCALIVVGIVPRSRGFVRRATRCDRSAPANSPACWPERDRTYLHLAQWVRDSTPRSAIFFLSKERAFYVHAGRKSINQDRGLQEDSASLGDFLRSRNVAYAAVSPVGVRSGLHNRLVAAACRDFSVVRQFSPNTILLRVRAADEARATDAALAADDSRATDDACAALAVWSGPRLPRR